MIQREEEKGGECQAGHRTVQATARHRFRAAASLGASRGPLIVPTCMPPCPMCPGSWLQVMEDLSFLLRRASRSLVLGGDALRKKMSKVLSLHVQHYYGPSPRSCRFMAPCMGCGTVERTRARCACQASRRRGCTCKPVPRAMPQVTSGYLSKRHILRELEVMRRHGWLPR